MKPSGCCLDSFRWPILTKRRPFGKGSHVISHYLEIAEFLRQEIRPVDCEGTLPTLRHLPSDSPNGLRVFPSRPVVEERQALQLRSLPAGSREDIVKRRVSLQRRRHQFKARGLFTISTTKHTKHTKGPDAHSGFVWFVFFVVNISLCCLSALL